MSKIQPFGAEKNYNSEEPNEVKEESIVKRERGERERERTKWKERKKKITRMHAHTHMHNSYARVCRANYITLSMPKDKMNIQNFKRFRHNSSV